MHHGSDLRGNRAGFLPALLGARSPLRNPLTQKPPIGVKHDFALLARRVRCARPAGLSGGGPAETGEVFMIRANLQADRLSSADMVAAPRPTFDRHVKRRSTFARANARLTSILRRRKRRLAARDVPTGCIDLARRACAQVRCADLCAAAELLDQIESAWPDA